MKLYATYPKHIDAIKTRFNDKVQMVDDKHQADYIISGVFQKEDYHPNLKGVIIPYTGHDRIDLEAMKEYQLKLFNTTVHSKFVAEKAIQLMFALLGNVVSYHNRLTQADWSGVNSPKRIPWESVFDKKIGIYGYGRIGQFIHEMLKPFQVSVYIIDRGKPYQDVLTVPSLDALTQTVDVLFITVPLTEHTEAAIDLKQLNHMNNGWVVNVGRGPVIDEDALYHVLSEGIIKGFASDVWFNYPKKERTAYPSKHPIHTFNNVVMSPHCGGFSVQSPNVMTERLLEHIDHLLHNRFDDALDLNKLK